MKIDQLPFEILMDIFSYLARYEEVLLVNQLFYNVACKVHDPNIYLTIDDNFFDGQWMSKISSIMDSTRQLSRLNIYSLGSNEAELRAVISVINKFSVSIKYLKLKMLGLVKMSEFLEILSLVPNVEHLICDNLRLRRENQPSSVDETSTDDDLNLRMLTKLKCRCCFNQFSVVFNRLPVRTIKELDLHDFNFDTAITLLKRQPNIRKLKLTACDSNYITAEIFNRLTLDALELWYTENFDLATVLSKQTKLKALKLRLVEVDKHLFDIVTNQFTELETLSMGGPFSMPENVSIVEIIRLKKLKNVTLLFNFTDELGLAKSLSESYNPGITALTIGYGIYEFHLIQALAKSVPNLKILKLDCYVYSTEADGFMRNFNFVEVLEIRRIVVVPLYDTGELIDGYYFNPKLKELVVNGDFVDAARFSSKLIASYPNLRKLEIKWKSITSWQVEEFIEGFSRLESVKLDANVNFIPTIKFLNFVKRHKKNLKFIELNGINVTQ